MGTVADGLQADNSQTAYKLREAFGDTVEFEIFEKNEDVGGTWFENRYPGKGMFFPPPHREICFTERSAQAVRVTCPATSTSSAFAQIRTGPACKF